MIGALIFWLWVAFSAVATGALILGAVSTSHSGVYITLDCRDGQHRGCGVCGCECHGAPA